MEKRVLKLVIHVASKDRWTVGSKNALNFLRTAGEGETLKVAIVANADAVTQCTACDRELFDRLKQIVLDGGELFLCANSLRDFDIPETRPPEIFRTVPAAIRALADMQADGWVYVRA
jgi:intracellular sulfur oxidation DsrE/DsrF family protein